METDETNDSHYIKIITELGDTNDVAAAEDIYAANGMKLVQKGGRINSTLYERILLHKLRAPLDRSLSIRDAVNADDLIGDAKKILTESVHLTEMANALADRNYLRYALADVRLNPVMTCKLTIAREKRPALYRHNIYVALIAMYLGVKSGLTLPELKALGAAGLFHDLGELYMAPGLLDRTNQLTEAERRHIYAHPVTTYLILKEFPEYHPLTSTAVLEHHERLDGSGYPFGIGDGKISRLGQILAVAEVAGTHLVENDKCDCTQLEIIMKLNRRQFNIDLTGHLTMLFKHEASLNTNARITPEQVQQQLDKVGAIFDDWENRNAAAKPSTERLAIYLINERVFNLKHALIDAGFNPREKGYITQGIENDPQGLTELASLVREAAWQINDILLQIERRWSEPGPDVSEAELAALQAWSEQAKNLLPLENLLSVISSQDASASMVQST